MKVKVKVIVYSTAQGQEGNPKVNLREDDRGLDTTQSSSDLRARDYRDLRRLRRSELGAAATERWRLQGGWQETGLGEILADIRVDMQGVSLLVDLLFSEWE